MIFYTTSSQNRFPDDETNEFKVMEFCPEGEPIDESAAVMQQPVPFMHVDAKNKICLQND